MLDAHHAVLLGFSWMQEEDVEGCLVLPWMAVRHVWMPGGCTGVLLSQHEHLTPGWMLRGLWGWSMGSLLLHSTRLGRVISSSSGRGAVCMVWDSPYDYWQGHCWWWGGDDFPTDYFMTFLFLSGLAFVITGVNRKQVWQSTSETSDGEQNYPYFTGGLAKAQ